MHRSPNEAVKSGQACGAQPEDIFGCLYFFISDQLRTFAKRIRELDITFHVFNTTPHTLARDISGGAYSRHNLTPRTRFDRVNLVHTAADARYTGDVLNAWTPLLAEGDTAAIIGVFPDWINAQKDGSVAGADDTLIAPIVDKLIKLGRVTMFLVPSRHNLVHSHVLHLTVPAWNDGGQREGHRNSAAGRCIR